MSPIEPDSVEEHSEGKFIIEIEFYDLPDGRLKVLPYLKLLDSEVAFVVPGEFATKEDARAATLKAGRERIAAGFRG